MPLKEFSSKAKVVEVCLFCSAGVESDVFGVSSDPLHGGRVHISCGETSSSGCAFCGRLALSLLCSSKTDAGVGSFSGVLLRLLRGFS